MILNIIAFNKISAWNLFALKTLYVEMGKNKEMKNVILDLLVWDQLVVLIVKKFLGIPVNKTVMENQLAL